MFYSWYAPPQALIPPGAPVGRWTSGTKGETTCRILLAEEDKFEDIFDGSMFDDWVGLKPGHIISPSASRLRYNQGADPESWASCGGSKYLPRDWQIMCGAAKDIFVARSSGMFEVTFPVPFGDNPIFLATVTATLPVFEKVYQMQDVVQSASVMEIYWWSVNNPTRIYKNWLAISPVAI